MVEIINKITPNPPFTIDQRDISNQIDRTLNHRIDQLIEKFNRYIPAETHSKFLIEGKIRHNGALDEVFITPMENVDLKLWEDKLQFILF